MSTTLVIHGDVARQLTEILREPKETAGVLLVRRVFLESGSPRLLAREFLPVSEEAYRRRTEYELEIASSGYVGALARAEQTECAAIWLHTHPGEGSSPQPSGRDEQVDADLADTFRIRTGVEFYGALILSPASAGFTFTGWYQDGDNGKQSITRIWDVSNRFRLTHSANVALAEPLAIFDRNVRAFGNAIQKALGELVVGIVGCGGTGSAVAEQLVRLGVRRFVLMDPKKLSDTNVTRVYGSTPERIGHRKVDICADNLRAIAPDVECVPYDKALTTVANATLLLNCDVVFGCTDDDAGRLVLSRLPTYFLLPVIDCGVLISSDEASGEIVGIDGRVTVLRPGAACLLCRGRIDRARANAQFLSEEEREKLAKEGYAPQLRETEAAVVTFTTTVAAAAVNELLERMISFGPDDRPTEVLWRFHEREVSRNNPEPILRHYCHASAGKLGLGFTMPFLEMGGGR